MTGLKQLTGWCSKNLDDGVELSHAFSAADFAFFGVQHTSVIQTA
jgi:hypothetical protein